MKRLRKILEKNVLWAESVAQSDPEFFKSLAKQQAPEYLWIGCSDSRVAANQIMGLMPGEVFVHRNIANVVVYTDLNCLSVVHYAVEVLEVKHIIICGHYGCGGVKASMQDEEMGLIDNWLRHIKDVARFNEHKLQGLNEEDRFKRLCELNVVEQVRNICNTSIVKNAWKNEKKLGVHGWIYALDNGVIKDLEVSRFNFEDHKQQVLQD